MTKKDEKEPKELIKLFLYSLVFSLMFWLTIQFNKFYTIETDIQLDYEIPRNISINSELPTSIKARIKVSGFKLVAINLGLKKLKANVETFRYLRLDENYKVVSASQLLQDKFGDEIQILETFPALITFDYIRKKSAELPIASNLKFVSDYDYFVIGNVEFEPGYTTVIAPPQLLLRRNQWYTIDTTISIEREKTKVIVPLEKHKNVYLSPQKTTAIINAKRFMELELIKKVKIVNKSRQLNVRIAPEKVRVKVLLPVDEVKEFNPEELNLYVDYKELSSFSSLLPVKSNKDSLEVLIKNVFIFPNVVDVVITKKGSI